VGKPAKIQTPHIPPPPLPDIDVSSTLPRPFPATARRDIVAYSLALPAALRPTQQQLADVCGCSLRTIEREAASDEVKTRARRAALATMAPRFLAVARSLIVGLLAVAEVRANAANQDAAGVDAVELLAITAEVRKMG